MTPSNQRKRPFNYQRQNSLLARIGNINNLIGCCCNEMKWVYLEIDIDLLTIVDRTIHLNRSLCASVTRILLMFKENVE